MPEIPEHNDPETGWGDTVLFAPGPDPIAYRPDEVIVGGERGRVAAERIFGGSESNDPDPLFPDVDEETATQLFIVAATATRSLPWPTCASRASSRTEPRDVRPQLRLLRTSPGPAMGERRDRRPGVREPGVCEPGVREPGVREPGVREPGVREPGVREPGERPVYANPVYANLRPVYANPALQATGKQKSSAKPALPRTRWPPRRG